MKRHGLTMLELAVCLASSSVLIAGLASSVYLASQTLPGNDNASRQAAQASAVVRDVIADVSSALTFTERTAELSRSRFPIAMAIRPPKRSVMPGRAPRAIPSLTNTMGGRSSRWPPTSARSISTPSREPCWLTLCRHPSPATSFSKNLPRPRGRAVSRRLPFPNRQAHRRAICWWRQFRSMAMSVPH